MLMRVKAVIVKNKKLFAITFLTALFLGGFLGFLVSSIKLKPRPVLFSEKRAVSGYKFINPLLECEVSKSLGGTEFGNLESKVKTFIDKTTGSNGIEKISYYYRDLNNGPWVGIDEKENFTPSSLLKLPILMAFLKQSETTPELLQKKIEYKKSTQTELTPIYKPSATLVDGQTYSIDDLLKLMIIYSDNLAKDLLLENINHKTIEKVYLDLNILSPPDTLADNFMNIKEYVSLFRVLFNVSYLNKEASEKALELLTRVEFKDGLPAGLPANIVVAHKFGERIVNGLSQLHDCGIVYYPSHPYLICIMTRGADFTQLSKHIQEISKITYDEMKEMYQ
jgi:beta-lactamase class A